jgi:hypothetical protein
MTETPPPLTNHAAATRLRTLLAQQTQDPTPLHIRLIKRLAKDDDSPERPHGNTE